MPRVFTDAADNLYFALEQVSRKPAGVYLAFHQQVFHAQSVMKMHTTELDAFKGIEADQISLFIRKRFPSGMT